MDSSTVALSVIFGIVLISSVVGMYAGSRYKMDLEQWTVAGRGFGLVLVWLLMAGEVYTTFAFLGASGWAYSRGAPTLYIMAYLTLAYVFSFYFLPQIWEIGKKFGMQTQSDFFRQRYGSKNLAAFASLVGVVFIIPYLQLQLTGLGIIVEVAGFGCEREVTAHKPVNARASLQIEFEGVAEVRRPDPGGTDTQARIHKRKPTRSRGEVVPQVCCDAHEPVSSRRELLPAE